MSYQSTVLADSPWAYWRLNDASGSTATDLGSGGNNATYTGSGTMGATGLLSGDSTSKSYSPGGLTTNFVLASGPLHNYPASNQISIECWVKPATADLGATFLHASLVGIRDPATNSSGLWWDIETRGDATSGHMEANWAASGIPDDQTASSLVAGTSYHVVATYDKSTGNRVLYVNGTAVVTVTGGATFFAPWPAGTNTTPPVTMGGLGSNTSVNTVSAFPLNGFVSDVALYTTILSSTRVTAHYTAGTTSGGTTYTKSLAASAADAGALKRRTAAVLKATQTTTGNAFRYVIARTLAAAQHLAESKFVRATKHRLSAAADVVASIKRKTSHHVSASLADAANLKRTISAKLLAAGSFVATLTASLIIVKSLSAALSDSARILKHTSRGLYAVARTSSVIKRRVTLMLIASEILTSSVHRLIKRFLSSAFSFIGSLTGTKSVSGLPLPLTFKFSTEDAITFPITETLALTFKIQ